MCKTQNPVETLHVTSLHSIKRQSAVPCEAKEVFDIDTLRAKATEILKALLP
jgi:hypothetical protein